MKLKNKNTGEVIVLVDNILDNYSSLAQFNEEWEDYKPLIKDKKTRKAVRAWAKTNELKFFKIHKQYFGTFRISGKKNRYNTNDLSIEFFGSIEDVEGITYKIEQLCGKEK